MSIGNIPEPESGGGMVDRMYYEAELEYDRLHRPDGPPPTGPADNGSRGAASGGAIGGPSAGMVPGWETRLRSSLRRDDDANDPGVDPGGGGISGVEILDNGANETRPGGMEIVSPPVGTYAKLVDPWTSPAHIASRISYAGGVISEVETACGVVMSGADLVTFVGIEEVAKHGIDVCLSCITLPIRFPETIHRPADPMPEYIYLHIGAGVFEIAVSEYGGGPRSGVMVDMARSYGWFDDAPFWLAKVHMVNGYRSYGRDNHEPMPVGKATVAEALADGCRIALERWAYGEREAKTR